MGAGRYGVGQGLVAALALGAAGSARAGIDEQPTSIGVGLLVVFGGGEAHAGVSFDVRHAWLIEDGDYNGCSRDPRSGLGLFGQLAWVRGQARLSAGLFGGAEGDTERPFPAWGAELGYTYRVADGAAASAHGLRLGATGFAALLEVGAGTSLWMGEALEVEPYFAAGVRLLGPFGGSSAQCDVGRPLRVAGCRVQPGLVTRGATRVGLDPVQVAIGAAWVEDLRSEAASVPAFLALARELRAVGAPRALVREARRAARDEVRHTQLCAGRAEAALGVGLAAAPLGTPRREMGLGALLVESWRDGCLGEGAAAGRARRAAAVAGGEAREVQREIARDEARHAELAWAVVEHTLRAEPGLAEVLEAEVRSEGGREVDAGAEAPGTCPLERTGAGRDWRRSGRPDAAMTAAALDEAHEGAVRRARALLDAVSPGGRRRPSRAG